MTFLNRALVRNLWLCLELWKYRLKSFWGALDRDSDRVREERLELAASYKEANQYHDALLLT